MIISIEGNIGSGKSTLLKCLNKLLKDDERFVFITEPINLWLKNTDKEGESILSKFYKNQEKYAFPFQVMSYTTKLLLLKEAIKNNPGKIIITERCVHTDKNVFAKMLYDENRIEDVCYNIYNMMFNEFLNFMGVDKFIYVNTDPIICNQRIKKRKRDGEGGIPLEYLNKCHNYHDEWMSNEKLNSKNVLCLNGDIEFENNFDIILMWKNIILEFVFDEKINNLQEVSM